MPSASLATATSFTPPSRGDYVPAQLGARCDLCPLAQRKLLPVPVPPAIPKGKPKLVIIGEAPGYYEAVRGEPFVGKSGMLLNSILGESKFHRNEAWIGNIAACRLEDERAEKEGAIACCSPRLAKELALVSPEIPILAVGNSASKPFISRAGIQRIRGFVWHVEEVDDHQLREATKSVAKREEKHRIKKEDKTLDQLQKARFRELLLTCRATLTGRVVIPSLHPAFILRGADMQLPVLRTDVDRAIRWARSVAATGKGLRLEDEGPYTIVKTPAALKRAIRGMRDHVSIDIESNAADALFCKITCIGLSDDYDDRGKTVVISPEKLRRGWHKEFAPILAEFYKTRTAVTHNGPSFDEIRLRKAGIKLPHLDDTLLGYHAFCGHNRKGLDHVTSIYCDSAPWKILSGAKGKGAVEKGGFYSKQTAELEKYNAADVRLTIRDWHRMQSDLETERRTYEFDMAVAQKICQQMQVAGMRIDVEKRRFLSKKLGFRQAALLGEMRRLLGRPAFNPGSLDDLRRALFKQCRVPIGATEMTDTGLPSTGKLLLEALRVEDTRAGKLADLVLRRRSALDTKAEYIDNIPVGPDGRVHPNWKIFGTRNGRPATSNPNALNMPRYNKDPEAYEEHVRAMYIAAEGHSFVYYDLKQSEPVFAAYISNDPVFIEDVKSDVHTVRTTFLFPKQAAMILADPKGKGATFRQITKTCGLAATYYSSPETVYGTCMRDDKIKLKPSLEECATLVDQLRLRYRGWHQFVQNLVMFSKKNGFIRSPFEGRLARIGFYAEDSLVANSMPQMGVADVMGRRLLEMERRKPKKARLVFYGYDSACYETPDADVPLMQKLCKELWEEPIIVPASGVKFVQRIDMKEASGRLSDF